MRKIIWINKTTGEPKTSLLLDEMSRYRQATADEQERYEKATANLTESETQFILQKHFNK